VPIGYLVTSALVALCTLFAVLSPRRPRTLAAMSFRIGLVLNELPFVAFYWLLASTLLAILQGDVDSPGGWAALSLAVLATVGLVVVARRGQRAGLAVDNAMAEGLGAGWRTAISTDLAPRLRTRLPWARILFGPFFVRRGDVERVANISYGDAGERNLRRVPPSLPSIERPHPGLPARGSIPQRPEEPRGTSPHLPARKPRLGVHQRELPPGPGREVS
jgi:hypothetical protein